MTPEAHLRSLWPKARAQNLRSPLLVVALGGDDAGWVYPLSPVWYPVVDIRPTPRRIRGQTRAVFTQGPMLAFAVGHLLHRRDGAECVQIHRAAPMAWRGADSGAGEMIHGVVHVGRYAGVAPGIHMVAKYVMTQMQFLGVLASGVFPERSGYPLGDPI